MSADIPDPVADLKTNKRLPPSLRGAVYESMLGAVSEELSVWREAIRQRKTSFYDVDAMDVERLTEICGTFGVPFITSVKSDVFFLREEVRSIPFKIYYKGTPILYKSFFYAVDRYGEMFVYQYRADVNDIVRSKLPPFDDTASTPPNLPFRHRSHGDFSGGVEGYLTLDAGLVLDAGNVPWVLDVATAEISTNHIGLEYFIDRIITRKDIDPATGAETANDYLMTKEYLNYMGGSVEFARRAKEVPHIGSQLSVQTDASGLCNSYDPSSEYTIPPLKLKAVTRPDYFSLVSSAHDIALVEFGVGKKEVASVQNPGAPFPLELASKVCSVPVASKDQLESAGFIGAVGECLGQALNKFSVLDGSSFDGESQDFDFSLPFAPIQRGNIILEFHLPAGDVLTVADDRKGLLMSLNGRGTVDYATGNCHISTKFDYSQVDSMEMDVPSGGGWITDGRTRFTHILQGGDFVAPGSLWLTFTSGEGADQRTYMANDDGLGRFTHPLIQSGLVDYAAKKVDVVFNSPLVDPSIKPFTCKYSFPVDFKLPEGTTLLASYFFTQQSIYITEAGFRGKDGDLLNYAVFPPFEFNSKAYHLDFMLLVKRPPQAS
jgi:hypothetical protein